ncbi:alpha/beta hydrolase fold domain-containing protein [Flavisolibacter tropicus]|uniref:Alpha/beta hydrolase fold-3 domain-containing protein n=1 Tax=Flavisolibacter tropicus TaxID=1492898 RepID=A0A172U2B8_9BACT|nr:alpha/beta hydrolase [Flavisolibacter tropicus]ANE53426.1 hypothetical protein SY85_10845 [Flavisolibacter tropicus]
MASSQSKLFTILLQMINKKKLLKRQLASRRFDLFSCPEPPVSLSKTCQVYRFQVKGRNVFRLQPKGKSSSKHILYLHGGAYIQSFVRFHWYFLAALVNAVNCTITVPDYPLAPAYTYTDSFAMVLDLYRQLLSAVDTNDLIIMGDSSGGGFALALAQKIRDEHIPQASQIILLSPWLDITLSNPDINDLDPVDPFLEKESLQQAGKLYAGDTNPDHYLLSPINGDIEHLGKMTVFAGSKEILVADARKLKSLADSKGVDLTYFEYADMFHAWMLLRFPEAKKARQQIIDLIGRS